MDVCIDSRKLTTNKHKNSPRSQKETKNNDHSCCLGRSSERQLTAHVRAPIHFASALALQAQVMLRNIHPWDPKEVSSEKIPSALFFLFPSAAS